MADAGRRIAGLSQPITVGGVPRFTTYTITAGYSGIETVNVIGADGIANTFTVQSTPATGRLNVFGGSQGDQFNIGDADAHMVYAPRIGRTFG